MTKKAAKRDRKGLINANRLLRGAGFKPQHMSTDDKIVALTKLHAAQNERIVQHVREGNAYRHDKDTYETENANLSEQLEAMKNTASIFQTMLNDASTFRGGFALGQLVWTGQGNGHEAAQFKPGVVVGVQFTPAGTVYLVSHGISTTALAYFPQQVRDRESINPFGGDLAFAIPGEHEVVKQSRRPRPLGGSTELRPETNDEA